MTEIALDRLRRGASLRRKLPLLVEPSGDGGPEPTDALRLVFTAATLRWPASRRSR